MTEKIVFSAASQNGSTFPLIDDQFVDMSFMTKYTGLTDNGSTSSFKRGSSPSR
ncbi:hypothetical protein [Alcaligenes faecalis]|uniref:hypothetical protein n=1 Tax=Alcaligenes faecalis TaxID=511 RepID=UPI001F0D8E10|nr:hypothetical protein [Alcaligenes faecalis]